MNSSLNDNNTNKSSRPTSFDLQQQQQQPIFNNNVLQQQQQTLRPYHLLQLATIQQPQTPSTNYVNNYYPFRVASTPRTPYQQQQPAAAAVLYPFDNYNLFDLKNNPSPPPSSQQQQQNDNSFSSLTNNNQSLPALERRSSSLNNLNNCELKPPSIPAPILPSSKHSDDLIDLNDVSTTVVDNDFSLFDPLFVAPQPVIITTNIKAPPQTITTTKVPTQPTKPRSNSNQQINTPVVESVKTMITKQLSLMDKIEKTEKFEFIEKSLNETVSEINTFEVFINDLKEQINSTCGETCSSSLSNSVIVYSSLLEQPIMNDIDIKLTIRHVDPQTSKTKQIFLTVSINCTVESFLHDILTRFELKDLNINSYLLKIHGKEEYLPVKEILGELKYIQDSLCLNKDPIFILIEIKNINKQLSLNRTNNETTTTKKDLFQFEIDSQTSLRNKLETLLKNIFRNKEEIDKTIKNCEQMSVLENFCHNFKFSIRELMKLVHKINYTSLIDLAEQLDLIELNLKSYHSKFELGELSKKLSTISNNVIVACVKFCNLASKSFEWPFKLKSFDDSDGFITEKREIIQAKEKLTFFIENINNLANFIATLNLPLK